MKVWQEHNVHHVVLGYRMKKYFLILMTLSVSSVGFSHKMAQEEIAAADIQRAFLVDDLGNVAISLVYGTKSMTKKKIKEIIDKFNFTQSHLTALKNMFDVYGQTYYRPAIEIASILDPWLKEEKEVFVTHCFLSIDKEYLHSLYGCERRQNCPCRLACDSLFFAMIELGGGDWPFSVGSHSKFPNIPDHLKDEVNHLKKNNNKFDGLCALGQHISDYFKIKKNVDVVSDFDVAELFGFPYLYLLVRVAGVALKDLPEEHVSFPDLMHKFFELLAQSIDEKIQEKKQSESSETTDVQVEN